MVITLLAADQSQQLAIPVGVVIGAIITFVGTWLADRRNYRYERLETLINVLKDWPEGLDGRDSAKHSAQIALAEIRRVEPGGSQPVTQGTADDEVRASARKNLLRDIAVSTVAVLALTFGIAIYAAFTHQDLNNTGNKWGLTILVVGAWVLGLLTRRR